MSVFIFFVFIALLVFHDFILFCSKTLHEDPFPDKRMENEEATDNGHLFCRLCQERAWAICVLKDYINITFVVQEFFLFVL